MPNHRLEAPAIARPEPDEYAEFYAGYVSRVRAGSEPVALLAHQLADLPARLSPLDETAAAYRYAPGKWSVKQVMGHLADTERVFAYRLLWIARADPGALPGFDENEWADKADSDARTLPALVAEWESVRAATLTLVRGVSGGAWSRRGVANGRPVSARALLYIIAGHTEHHLEVLKARYRIGSG